MLQDFVTRGALMPDAHTGYSLPIGAVVETKGYVVPSWVGYDQGCGVCAVPTDYPKDLVIEHAQEIFHEIYKLLPVGFSRHKHWQPWDAYASLKKTTVFSTVFEKGGANSLGTLGGGNHFCEIGYDRFDIVWIIVHSGSRGVGHGVATHYMKLASGDGRAREGHFGFAVDTLEGQDFITDLNCSLKYALHNRKMIVDIVGRALSNILCSFPIHDEVLINRNHNHATSKDGIHWIHRKGATHAEEGMLGVIPGNMRDGSFIVEGKGFEDSLCSSSHGAGRILGRKKAKQLLNVEDFKVTMNGIVASVSGSTLDESPFAYKDIFSVMDQQTEMVKIINYIKPIINIKG
jgi:tRNA-splicing ligase RtcB